MGITVTNPNTLSLLNIINRTNTAQSTTLERLATGFKINRAADDPAGLIALRSMEAELVAVDSAVANGQRANAWMGVADGALTEISKLLTDIESLVSSSTSNAALSAAELAANQSQIDAALDSLDRIVRTTSFNGRKLLDGSQAILATGVNSDYLADMRVYSRGNLSSNVTMTVDITASATQAAFSLANTGGNATSGATQVALTGSLGTATITIASGAAGSDIASTVNQSKDLTGVSASLSGNYVQLHSTGFGSDEFISVDVLSGGDFVGGATAFQETTQVTGQDASVYINGQAAVADGLDVSYNGNSISLSFSLTSSFAQQTSTDTTFTVSASTGATFQLGTDATTRATLGIDAVYAHKLGGGDSGGVLSDLRSGGAASLNTDTATAMTIVRKAVNDVATVQGRVGGFQKFQVQTAINSLSTTKASLEQAKSVIADVDYATETAELSRQNVLLQSAIALLGVANQQSANVLSLLR